MNGCCFVAACRKCSLPFCQIYSLKRQYLKEMKRKERELQPSPEIKWYTLLLKYSLLPIFNRPLSEQQKPKARRQTSWLHSHFNQFLSMTPLKRLFACLLYSLIFTHLSLFIFSANFKTPGTIFLVPGKNKQFFNLLLCADPCWFPFGHMHLTLNNVFATWFQAPFPDLH